MLTAVARDTLGNTATSSPVTVTVSNTGVSTVGLRAAYGLDDGAGTTAVDSSGNHKTATLAGGAGWSTSGRYGGAVTLNGTTSEVDPPALGTFYKTAFTLEAWVLKQSTKVDVGVVGAWVGGQGGGAMIWVDHAGRSVPPRARARASANYVDSGRTPTVGQWQHVAATYDGTTARFYVDGVETASAPYSGNVGDANSWRIGAYGSPATGFFDGLVDNVRIYDRALSASEIETDAASRIQPDSTAPSVTQFSPAPGATGVSIGTVVTATFDEPMKASSITTTTVRLTDTTTSANVTASGHVRRCDQDREADAAGRAPVRPRVPVHREGRRGRRQGSRGHAAGVRRDLDLHDRGVAAAGARPDVRRRTASGSTWPRSCGTRD